MKQKLLIFSQCFIYGGSERLMQSIYKNKYILNDFDITLSYSYYKDYELGLLRDSLNQKILAKFQPLFLISNSRVFFKIDKKFRNKTFRRLMKIPLFIIELTGIYALWNSFYFIIFLYFLKPNIVHINNGGYPAAEACNQLALVLIFFPSIRVIYQVNNMPLIDKNILSRLKDNFIAKSVDIFLTHSKQNQKALIKRGFKESSVVSFPSYFNESIIPTKLTTLKLTDVKFTLCMVGYISYRKGQLFLLKALSEIKSRNHPLIKNLHLNIIGDGEDVDIIKKYIDNNQLNEIVTLYGLRFDYLTFIQECDMYMMTSIENEDLPLVLLSAMENKKCIIATDFAGISDLLTHNIDAYLIKPDLKTISNDIADAIIYLYEHPEVRSKLSELVGKTYKENVSEEKYSYNLISLYKP